MTTLFSVIGKAALGLALVVSLSGSAQGQELAQTTNGAYGSSTWLINVRWDGGPAGNTLITFTQTNPNGGTFVARGVSGRYFQRPGDARAVFALPSATPPYSIVYSLTVGIGGRSFSGIMGNVATSGSRVGTHSAIRVRSAKDQSELRDLLLEADDDVSLLGDDSKPAPAK